MSRQKRLKRMDDLSVLIKSWAEQGWASEGCTIPNEAAINNAKAISIALSILGVEHYIYPLVDVAGGINLEFDEDKLLEIKCFNSGEVKTEEFEDDITISYNQNTITHSNGSYASPRTPGCSDHNVVEPHGCPFAEEIRNDYTTLCQCCDSCTEQCAQDI